MNTTRAPINPHNWRKFMQAQRNMQRALNMTRQLEHDDIGEPGAFVFNGNRRTRKQFRRFHYWSNIMRKLLLKVIP